MNHLNLVLLVVVGITGSLSFRKCLLAESATASESVLGVILEPLDFFCGLAD